MYSYNRIARGQHPYSNGLTEIQERFVGEVGDELETNLKMLHKRLGRQDLWSEVSGFQNWTHGPVEEDGQGRYHFAIYLQSAGTLPGDIDPTMGVFFKFDNNIEVSVKNGHRRMLSRRYDFKSSPARVALSVYEAWENLLTGSVNYGD